MKMKSEPINWRETIGGRYLDKRFDELGEIIEDIIAFVRESLVGPPIFWTKEKPKKAGWYWYRSKNARTRIVEFDERNGTLVIVGKTNRYGLSTPFPYGVNAEYCGPLEEPEEENEPRF